MRSPTSRKTSCAPCSMKQYVLTLAGPTDVGGCELGAPFLTDTSPYLIKVSLQEIAVQGPEIGIEPLKLPRWPLGSNQIEYCWVKTSVRGSEDRTTVPQLRRTRSYDVPSSSGLPSCVSAELGSALPNLRKERQGVQSLQRVNQSTPIPTSISMARVNVAAMYVVMANANSVEEERRVM